MKNHGGFSSIAALLLFPAFIQAQTSHRPPAVPLVANDPFFSIWSMADKLTDQPTRHWTEAAQPMTGLLRIDGHVFRWMGTQPSRPGGPAEAPAMEQTSLEIAPLHTRYRFAAAGIDLRVTFFTPSFPADLDVLSRPVTYLAWSATAIDGATHQVDLLLDVSPMLAVNDRVEQVTWGQLHTGNLDILQVGTRDQDYLHQTGDRVRIDWGYFHLGVPSGNGAKLELSPDAMKQFAATGQISSEDTLTMPAPAGSSTTPHLAAQIPFGAVGTEPVERHVLLAYTDRYGAEYLGRRLRDYWQRNGMTESALITTAESEYEPLDQRGVQFDQALQADMAKLGGPDYAYLGSLLFRQTLAAHKLVADIDGTPMFFSKENGSGGFIDTVDVTYPSSPFFLLFNPKLLEAQLEPVMRYASLPRWKFPFAPHDLGSFPLANGQLYGGGEATEEDQMPVEESGNLLLMIAGLGRAQGNWDFARRYIPELTKWADYLAAKGLDPENQLSTDDFAGHLAHNTNLSIKAIEALGAFVEIARGVGDNQLAERYQKLVHPLAAKWATMAREGDHYKLAFDQPGTWSQKYNLVWDDLLGLHLFPPSVAGTEWSFYSKNMQPNGLPLDSRKLYTKLDWELWTAALSKDSKQSDDLMHRIVLWLDTTPSRVPTTDWYDTQTGRQMGFQARSVVGGIFIKALLDPAVSSKWKAVADAH